MGQRRTSNFRQTRLQFKKPGLNQQLPSSQPSQTPLKPLPRPTAPPVFRNSTPRKRRRTEIPAIDDELWDMGRRIAEGDTLHPKKSVMEECNTHENNAASASDDDFEPESVISQVARQRPQLLTPPSRMRNDRSSMTKSSANRKKKNKKAFAYTTSSQKRDSMHLTNPKPSTGSFLDSSSSEEDVEHVVFEGEKSELSDTDEDTPIASLRRKKPAQEKNSRASLTDYPRANAKRNKKSPVREETSVRKPPVTPVLINLSQSNAAKKPQTSLGQIEHVREFHRDFGVANKQMLTEPVTAPKRACDLPQLFACDSDDSIDLPIKRRSHQKRMRRIRRVADSSDEDIRASEDRENPRQPSTRVREAPKESEDIVEPHLFPESNSQNEGPCEMNHDSRVIDVDKECPIGEPKRKPSTRSSLSSDEHGLPDIFVSKHPFHSGNESGTSPVRSRTRRRLSFTGSQDNEITPPSTPSPPSTRKRRFLSKLVTTSSDEDDDPVADPLKNLKECDKSVKCGKHQGLDGESEWYHERRIDMFSSSGEEAVECIDDASLRKINATHSKKRVSASKPGTRSDRFKLSSNLRDPLLEVSEELVDVDESGRSPTSKGNASAGVKITNQDNNEVIDLVDDDDDDFEDISFIKDQKDRILSSNDCIEGDISVQRNGPPACNIDDSKPPPFNLYVLCNEGESIIEMRDRLGEDALMDRVMQARNDGREIVGGDQLGLTTSFNKAVFSLFSKTVVGDTGSRKNKTASVTDKALRGEFKFNYRGKGRDQRQRGGDSRKRGSSQPGKRTSYRNRLSSLGHRRR